MRRTWRACIAIALVTALSAPAGVLPAVASTTTAADDAQTVFRTINRERAAHALPALRWNSLLAAAAHAHNALMARYDTLSHQVGREPALGARVTAVGYAWRAVGENIGASSDCSLTGVLDLQRMMYHEVPPNDQHRRNILNTSFRAVGVDVIFDSTHRTAWLTEVFAAPA